MKTLSLGALGAVTLVAIAACGPTRDTPTLEPDADVTPDGGVVGEGGVDRGDGGVVGEGGVDRGDAGGDGDTGPTVTNNTFREPFDWRGAHAATTEGVTTVEWNSDAWDVRGDSDLLSTDVTQGVTSGFALDIRKAQSDAASAGQRASGPGANIVGGDGSRGVGVMRLDEQDIASARLRNPMLISTTRPGIVTFYASRFVTMGHWWEVAITPAQRIVGAEFTAVPGNGGNCDTTVVPNLCNDGLAGPTVPTENTPGPGHRPAEEAINVITTGWPDAPLCQGFPFFFRSGVKAQIGGKIQDVVNYVANDGPQTALPITKPEEIDDLFAWRIEYRPDGIDVYADFDRDGSFKYHQHLAINIPWSEVHVHLMGLAYQADHHPQKGCGWQGTTREIVWRDVTVSPVRYPRTSIAPKEGAARAAGWMYYDLRDVQNFGLPVNGAPQPNDAAYDEYSTYLFGSVPNTPRPVTTSQTLKVDLADDQVHAAAARLLYDIEGRGTATVTVNGHSLGAMPAATSVPAAGSNGESPLTSDFRAQWVRRGIDVPTSALVSGTNTVEITLNGAVVMDRLQLEFDHETP